MKKQKGVLFMKHRVFSYSAFEQQVCLINTVQFSGCPSFASSFVGTP